MTHIRDTGKTKIRIADSDKQYETHYRHKRKCMTHIKDGEKN